VPIDFSKVCGMLLIMPSLAKLFSAKVTFRFGRRDRDEQISFITGSPERKTNISKL